VIYLQITSLATRLAKAPRATAIPLKLIELKKEAVNKAGTLNSSGMICK